VVELGIVLGHSLLLVNVGFGVALDLIKGEMPIVVDEVDEILVRLERILWDHQNVHPATSDSLVFQSCKENLDPIWFAVLEGVAWEGFDPGLVDFGSLWCGVVNDAIIGKHWS